MSTNQVLLWFNRTNALVWVWIAVALARCGGGTMGQSRQLIAINVQPSNGNATAPAGTLPFSVVGTFTQPPTEQTNLIAQWSSSNSNIATIDNTGVATCVVAGGPIYITGSVGGIKGSAKLTCLASP